MQEETPRLVSKGRLPRAKADSGTSESKLGLFDSSCTCFPLEKNAFGFAPGRYSGGTARESDSTNTITKTRILSVLHLAARLAPRPASVRLRLRLPGLSYILLLPLDARPTPPIPKTPQKHLPRLPLCPAIHLKTCTAGSILFRYHCLSPLGIRCDATTLLLGSLDPPSPSKSAPALYHGSPTPPRAHVSSLSHPHHSHSCIFVRCSSVGLIRPRFWMSPGNVTDW
ncbi:hypothetical protein MSAN_01108600 [Mycena sanguinolenta]|uniref:Uncharacterized protein n=1 Tax=Mycena sanguinolenta TaxID=230812 RepID=A0A8H6YSN8_9AGAR|nr:hypothetical protein MSAN_01108600 [Mycena sanguinolenta]